MTSEFPHMLLTSIPIGWQLMQLCITWNSPREKFAHAMQPVYKLLWAILYSTHFAFCVILV